MSCFSLRTSTARQQKHPRLGFTWVHQDARWPAQHPLRPLWAARDPRPSAGHELKPRVWQECPAWMPKSVSASEEYGKPEEPAPAVCSSPERVQACIAIYTHYYIVTVYNYQTCINMLLMISPRTNSIEAWSNLSSNSRMVDIDAHPTFGK